MVSDETLKARVVAELYRDGVYHDIGNWMAVTDLADRIAPPAEQGSADEGLKDLFRIDLSVLAELKGKRAGENGDEKIKKLVLVDFTVCLL